MRKAVVMLHKRTTKFCAKREEKTTVKSYGRQDKQELYQQTARPCIVNEGSLSMPVLLRASPRELSSVFKVPKKGCDAVHNIVQRYKEPVSQTNVK